MASETLQVDVLIVGGGAGGCSAAWQAARAGARVLVAEETPWLGGMITSAGVSAFDGNKYAMASGFHLMLRNALEEHYGGKDAVFTGWISLTCFEPHVAARWLNEQVVKAGAEVWFGARFAGILKDGNRVTGARIEYGGEVREVQAKVTVDGTEYGDVILAAGCDHRLGREARSETGEEHAPEAADMEVQDLTWCATLKKHDGKAPAVPAPANYDPKVFDGCIAEYASTDDEDYLNHRLHQWDSFITYASLPNDKYLLNWPFHSNDSPDTNGVFGTQAEREEAFRKAKERTLAFVHFMQNELGHPEWGLATDEYGTPDHLAMIPYIRECRRIIGTRIMKEDDVLPAVPGAKRAKFQPDGIAIGDYFLDHHHSKEHLPPDERIEEDYPDNAPFQVPFGCLVPKEIDGLLACEKNISVTHIVNGCTRLQPCVMLIGQSVGMAAAMAAKEGIEPRGLNVRELQDALIDNGVAVYPWTDLYNDHPAFGAGQRIALSGVLAPDEPFAFEPDRKVTSDEVKELADALGKGGLVASGAVKEGMTRGELFIALDRG